MADFSVVEGDLDSLSSNFAKQARAYEGVVPKMSPPVADAGDKATNAAIQCVVDLLGLLNRQMVSAIDNHSVNLHSARETYSRTEDENKNRFLYDNLTEGFV